MQPEKYIDRCIELAMHGNGTVAPNPMVGALLLKDDQIIGEGYHTKYGAPHAEVEAITEALSSGTIAGSTLFVNLEPCCHQGKTPPCTELIIKSGISKVVFACDDPFPLMRGAGAHALRNAGIEVHKGIRAREAILLNRRFYTAHHFHRPYVILKWAETRDGFIAKKNYESKWISGEKARVLVHRWRAEEQAVMVGYRTALHDNPALTVRHVEGPQPLRVVIDRDGSLPKTHALFNSEAPTFVIDTLSPQAILAKLAERKIISVIIEGGATLLQRFIDASLWDEARVFQSKNSFGDGISAPRLDAELHSTSQIGDDTLRLYQSKAIEHMIQSFTKAHAI